MKLLHQIPSIKVASRHLFEVIGGNSDRDFNECFQINCADLGFGNRFATKVVTDCRYRRCKTGITQSDHDDESAIALAVAADARARSDRRT
jgi:hypothetical protein